MRAISFLFSTLSQHHWESNFGAVDSSNFFSLLYDHSRSQLNRSQHWTVMDMMGEDIKELKGSHEIQEPAFILISWSDGHDERGYHIWEKGNHLQKNQRFRLSLGKRKSLAKKSTFQIKLGSGSGVH
ncbi:hypothetical protein F0562_030389 [Nyssa sinensis]|uniref:Uncharacterized protein n=1 Tax=Nyssa sinensis TaxID=561372 RepID=A0A5J5AZQ4_9ASTE|nr:hypothetical protein F0562_030389 [Nyssa sinensis]